MKFKVQGHENILATHKTTFEFTKEDFLTKRGDCILGVNADLDFEKDISKFRKALNSTNKKIRKIKILLNHGPYSDMIVGFFNNSFSHPENMVIRKSAFIDERTFAYKANKSANELNKDIFNELKKKRQKGNLHVEMFPVKIRNIIFDFDDTLEEWTNSEKKADELMADKVAKEYKISKSRFLKEFLKAEHRYIMHTTNPKKYGRDVWIKDTFNILGIKATKKEILGLVDYFWQQCEHLIKLEKHVHPVLDRLYRKYNLYILSDSDGSKEIKMKRIRKLGLDQKYFKDILSSDDTMSNKPSKEAFEYVLRKEKIKPEECISIGDHAQTDLYTPKTLGMTTVWIKQGHWADSKVDYNYIDFEIKDLAELLKIVKSLE